MTQGGQIVNWSIRSSDYVRGMRYFEMYAAELRRVYCKYIIMTFSTCLVNLERNENTISMANWNEPQYIRFFIQHLRIYENRVPTLSSSGWFVL